MVKILVAEPSYLIRKGILTILNELKAVTKVEEASDVDELQEALETAVPHILLVNTTLSGMPKGDRIIEKHIHEIDVIPIFNTTLPDQVNEKAISIFDSKAILLNKLGDQVKIIRKSVIQHDNSDELTDREKDVLQKVALGKTNKEVANELFISTHTVISHRKNITRKLGIKTVSGLTVYAILNQLIKLEDIS